MLIKDMFTRNIGREIENVITVGGKEENSAFEQQELEEYVVTDELQKHFKTFFKAYRTGIDGTTPKMGVWITGFFGSGKSHFLKMLYFLLSGKVVNGKAALDYFREDNKIKDAELWTDIETAVQTPTDAIIFNIDAKNSVNTKTDKEAIVKVFLKVFNDMQGYYGENAVIADLEHELEETGCYEEFQQKFFEKKVLPDGRHLTWLENRKDYKYNQDIIVAILTEMGFMSEEAARNWCKSALNHKDENISIEQFAQRVKEYLGKKGNNHHIVFLVDEVSQFIADDSQLMLNLQTVTEELGKACQGKVWIVVTGQQGIDELTAVKGLDFSKIQGRFDTRISLTPANVDEVVKERILQKTPTAEDTLELLYEDKETTIKNLISFTGTAEKKIYENKKNFAEVYPFVGYQFDLLGKTLTAVRNYGATGKSIADGERSMISFFKEVANSYKEQDDSTLIPFSAFYGPLNNFLDDRHSSVIVKAAANKHINPEDKDQVFAIEVLKALSMIKYVHEMEANVENITSLMVDSIQEERGTLRQAVSKALELLEQEMLIQRQGDVYIFLTNEEQEINQRISHQEVEGAEVIHKAGSIIFDEILTTRSYRYPAFNGRYTFNFDKKLDNDDSFSNTNNALKLQILTPWSDYDASESTMASVSLQLPGIVMQLPEKADYLLEIRKALQIQNFLKKDTEAQSLSTYEEIRARKTNEVRERLTLAKSGLEDALRDASIYIRGGKTDIGAKETNKRVEEALEHLTKMTFVKLSYITKPVSESDIRDMLKQPDSRNIMLLDGGGEADADALHDMQAYVTEKAGTHSKITYKLLKDHFMLAPYGFILEDVAYLTARLYKRGELSLSMNGEEINASNTSDNDLGNYLLKKAHQEKLMIAMREKVADKDKKVVRNLLKELFGNSTQTDDEDTLKAAFQQHAQTTLGNLKNYEGQLSHAQYPGREIIEKGMQLLESLVNIRNAAEFFREAVRREDDLLDFGEDYEKVDKFFKGEQKKFFDEATRTYQIYERSQNYLVNPELEKIAQNIRTILQNPKPYRMIKDLPALREAFNDVYDDILSEQAKPVKETIEDYRKRVFDELEQKPFYDEMAGKFRRKFEELRDEADTTDNLNDLLGLTNQAKAIWKRFLREIAAKETQMKEALEKRKKEQAAKGEAIYESGTCVEKPSMSVSSNEEIEYHPQKTAYVTMREAAGFTSVEIHNEEELDRIMEKLKEQFRKRLAGLDSIHIEF